MTRKCFKSRSLIFFGNIEVKSNGIKKPMRQKSMIMRISKPLQKEHYEL